MSNIVLMSEVTQSNFSGNGNILIGTDTGNMSSTQSNTLMITNNNGTSAFISGDMQNNNFSFFPSGLTGPNLQGGQNIVFIPVTSTVPSAGITGGLGLFTTDGLNMQMQTSTGATSIVNSTFYTWTGAGAPAVLSPASTKFWWGRTTSTSGQATFNVTTTGTSTGPAIYANLTGAYIVTNGQANTSSQTAIPFTSIFSISGKQIVVNVASGNSGTIGALGGSYTGMQTAPNGSEVTAFVIGS